MVGDSDGCFRLRSLGTTSREATGVNLESLRRAISNEIQRLDQRRAMLLEKMVHIRALEQVGPALDEEVDTEMKPTPGLSNAQTGKANGEEMLAALRCLKCGTSLRRLIPIDSNGEPSIGNPRLGRSEGGNRFLECPQCQGKNIIVRTQGPRGWRLVVTHLK